MSYLKALNNDTYNLIMDFANINDYWRRRFSNDVLPNIDKYYKICHIENNKPCISCYNAAVSANISYQPCESCLRQNIQEFVAINFEEFRDLSKDNLSIYGERHWYILANSGPEVIINAFRECDYMNVNYKGLIKYDIILNFKPSEYRKDFQLVRSICYRMYVKTKNNTVKK